MALKKTMLAFMLFLLAMMAAQHFCRRGEDSFFVNKVRRGGGLFSSALVF